MVAMEDLVEDLVGRCATYSEAARGPPGEEQHMARMIESLPIQKCAGRRESWPAIHACQKAAPKVRPGAMGGLSAPALRLRVGRIRSFGVPAGRLTSSRWRQ